MNEPMTFTVCSERWHEIPWGELRIVTQVYEGDKLISTKEVCRQCFIKPQTRGRTGSAPGDTEATSQATVHATGDSGGGGAEGPLKRSLAPGRVLSVRGSQ